MCDHHSADRRVRRTRGRLHAALASLIHQKPYGDIVLKEILARADVGRSTFYAHFRDKDALLAGGIRDLLQALQRAGERAPRPPGGFAGGRSVDRVEGVLGFSRPLFEHLEQVAAAAPRAGGADGADRARLHAAVHERLRDLLAESVEARLREGLWGQREPTVELPVPAALLARHVAATFVLVLEWWAEDGMRVPARDADVRFRALVFPALADALRPAAAYDSD